MTVFTFLMLCLSSTVLGFTIGLIVSDIKFVRPTHKLLKGAMAGWQSALELAENARSEMEKASALIDDISKMVEGLPVKSLIQVKK